MRNIKLVLEYDGINYAGWQKQKDQSIHTVQGAVEKAIHKITNEEVLLFGCSRTDSKVSAAEYVCNFYTNCRIPGESIKNALNNYLPDDIVVLSSCEVDEKFHSRYNSKGKMYCYTIYNSSTRGALNRNRCYHYRFNLNTELMEEACKYLIGTHDFSAFKKKGSSVKTSVRTVYDIKVKRQGDYIKIYLAADGFLYNMARIIVGTLVRVGNEQIEPIKVKEILEARGALRAGNSVPPQGLMLIKVYY